jgi:RNA polymerase sigma factor (sigma-70 family)
MSPQEIESQWNHYYPKVYGYFFRRIENQNDVEDLTSIVLSIFMDALNRPDMPLQNPHAYLWRVAHNHLVNFINSKSKILTTIPIDENLDSIDTEIETHRSRHFQDKVENLMECVERTLEGVELTIVKEVVMFDKKSVEVAAELNLKPDNVRQKLSRSLKKLKQHCTQLWLIHTH